MVGCYNFYNFFFRFEEIRHVKFDDKLDIFCPEVSTNSNPETLSSSHLYQTIHLVDRDAYESCLLNGSEKYVSSSLYLQFHLYRFSPICSYLNIISRLCDVIRLIKKKSLQ